MRRGTANIVYGPIASGKSTFARRLAGKRNAIRFDIDEWMQALFGADRPATDGMAWALERVDRCRHVIGVTCLQILASGRDVVLETGLMRESHRAATKAQIEDAGFECVFYFVEAPRELRLARLMQRNQAMGETFSFVITPAMFETIEHHFEGPSSEEATQTRFIDTDDDHARD